MSRAFGRRTLVLLLASAGAALFVVPGSAWATTGHSFAGQFGGAGSGDGQFLNGLWGTAVMPSTGEVFTLSGESGRVQRFSAEGMFQSSFTTASSYNPVGAIAVDPAGSGAVYLLVWKGGIGSAVVKYSASGVFAYELDAASAGLTIGFSTSGAFSGNPALAVDPVDGTVYVAATDNGTGAQVIASFDQATGAFIDSFDGSDGSSDGAFCATTGLAVDSSHRVYVLDSCKGRVDQYSATGVWGATVDDGSRGPLSAVAADPVSDEVYVSEAGPVGVQVTHFTAGGAAPIYTFDASNVGGVRAMAVSGVGTVYTADARRTVVQRFARFDGPTVVTGGVSSVEARSAVLEGTIDPEGVESSYYFEYGLDHAYGSRTIGDIGAGSGSDPVAASVTATGLKPNTTYHYRIVGSNASGSIDGPDQTFTTGPAPATVDGVPAFVSAIGPRSARIHGTMNPNGSTGQFAEYYFEYGTTTYGQSPARLLCFSCGVDDVSVAESLSNLLPGTTYHFRVVGNNGFGGPQVGADQTFITAPAAAGGATDVTTKRATLTGTINPHGEATTYYFNYGPTSNYGASTPEVDGGSDDGDQQVSQSISGLEPDTVYHVQVVAKTGDVVRFGGDGLFKTPPAPTAVAISPTGISTDAVTLAGDVETHGLTGTYRFDVSSLDGSYSSSTSDQLVSGQASVERVTAQVSGLPAGETFVAQLIVDSGDSIAVSDEVTFATAPSPRVFPTAPTSSLGCKAPRLDAYDQKPKPGDTIRVTGRDLGIGGDAVLGDRSLVPADWTATGFTLEVPDDAAGTLGLTVDCGQRSNTIAIAIASKPNSKFSIRKQAATPAAVTLSVKVPGPGKLNTTGTNTKPAKTTVKKAGRATLKVKLTRAGRKALHNSGALRVATRVRFTPDGGKPATKTITLTFKKAGR